MSSTIKELYQKLIDFGLSKKEIDVQIKKKSKEYQGFISEQGILFIIAKENGINLQSSDIGSEVYAEFEEEIDYNEFAINISEIREGMSNIVLVGKIIRIFKPYNFTRKDGSEGIVGSFLIIDSSGVIKIVVWDENVKVMKNRLFQEQTVVQLIGGYSKIGTNMKQEVHIGKRGQVVLSPDDLSLKKRKALEDLHLKKIADETKYQKPELKIDDLVKQHKYISQIQGNVQIQEFKEINKSNGEKNFLLKFLISENSMSIRVLAWGMHAVNCLKIIDDGDLIILTNLLVKKNPYSNEHELIFTKNSTLKIL